MRIGTIYSASDKSLFDALNQKNVTNADLRELFLSRGIVVSRESTRKQLAYHFSRLFHDYYDYQTLARLFGSSSQRDKLSSVRLSTSATLDGFQSAAFELKAELEQLGAYVRVGGTSGTRLDIEVRYSKVQFNKSEFRQVSSRSATISIYQENGGYLVNSPHTDEAREWIDKLAKFVREKTEANIEFDEIRLPMSMEAKVKTAFFTHMIRGLSGMKLEGVSDVYVSKKKRSRDDDPEEGNPEIRIDKASLRGQGVLESDELKLLEKKGFYVSRIVWTTQLDLEGSDIFEFEAQFAIPDECLDFTYLPRGFYKCNGPGEYNQTRTAFSSEDEKMYGKLIESAARATIKTLPGHGHD